MAYPTNNIAAAQARVAAAQAAFQSTIQAAQIEGVISTPI